MKLKEICDFLEAQNIEFDLIGDPESEIDGYSALNEYRAMTITWVRGDGKTYDNVHPEYALAEKNCVVSIKNKIICENPKEVFFEIMKQFFDNSIPYANSDYFIRGEAKLGEDVIIGKGSIIDGEVSIGKGSVLGYDVKLIGKVQIGENCIIKSGVIIGESDIDFYFTDTGERHITKQYGGVLIGDNVIIGPNTVINKGSLGNTVIGDNVIIDDRCNISHNVKIGKNTAIISGTALLGSSEIGEHCYISTSVIRNGVKIGNNVTVGLGSAVVKDLPSNVVAFGCPAETVRNKAV